MRRRRRKRGGGDEESQHIFSDIMYLDQVKESCPLQAQHWME